MPHENKFPDRAHAENKLSVQTKFDTPPLSESNSRPFTLRSKGPKV